MHMPLMVRIARLPLRELRQMIVNAPIATEMEQTTRSMVRVIAKERSAPLFLQDRKRATCSVSFPKCLWRRCSKTCLLWSVLPTNNIPSPQAGF